MSYSQMILQRRGRVSTGGQFTRGLRGSSSGILLGQGLSPQELNQRESGESNFVGDTLESLGHLIGDIPAMTAGALGGAVAGAAGGPVGAAAGAGAGSFAAPEVIKALYEEYQQAHNDLGNISFTDYLKAVAKRGAKAGAKGAIFGAVASKLLPLIHNSAAGKILDKLPTGAAIAGSHAIEATSEAGILSALDVAFDDKQPVEAFRDNLALVLGAKLSMGAATGIRNVLRKHPEAKAEIAEKLLLEYKGDPNKAIVLPQKHELSPENRPLLEYKQPGTKENPINVEPTETQRKEAEKISEKISKKKSGQIEEPVSEQVIKKRNETANGKVEKEQKEQKEEERRFQIKEQKEQERLKQIAESDPNVQLIREKISEIEDSIESINKRLFKDPKNEREKHKLDSYENKLQSLERALEKRINRISEQNKIDHKRKYSDEALVEKMATDFGLPIRHGKLTNRHASGQYKPHERVVRLRDHGDFDTAAHEIGHDLEKAFFPDNNYKEIEPFRGELLPIATEHREGQDPISEGFAEFSRLYMTDPQEARSVAPKFYDHFENMMREKKPKALEAMHRVQDEVKSINNRSPTDYTKSRIDYEESPNWYEKAKRAYGNFKNDPKKWLRSRWEDFYANWVDAASPVYGYSPEAYRALRLHSGVDSKVTDFLHGRGVTNFDETKITSPSMEKILEPIGKDYKDFDAYLLDRRTMDLGERDIATGISPEIAKAAVIELEQKFPHFRKIATELQNFQDAVLQYYRDSGMLSDKSYDSIKEKNLFYVPLNRVFEGTVDTFSPRSPNQLIHKIVGSRRKVRSPLENIARNTAMMTRMASRNDVFKTLAKDMATRENLGSVFEHVGTEKQSHKSLVSLAAERAKVDPALFESVPTDILEAMVDSSRFTKDGNNIKIFIDGTPHAYNVDPLLYQAFGTMSRREVPMMVDLMAAPAASLRNLTTHSPDFVIRAFIKDIVEGTIKSQHGITMGDITKGVATALKKEDLYWKWMGAKGGYVSPSSMNRRSMLDKTLKLQKSGIKENYLDWIHAFESGARIAEFKKGIEKYGDTKEGRARAALDSREITLDFAKMGIMVPNLNRIIAFSAAHINGIDSFVRSFKPRFHENGSIDLRPYWRMASWVGLPSAIVAAFNSGEDWYEQQPAYVRDGFWLAKIGDKVIRVPKPHGYGSLLGSSIEKFVSYANGHNPHAIQEIKSVLLGTIESRLVVPTSVIPIIESWANKTIFTGRTLVPEYRKGFAPHLQYSPYTTEVSKKTAQIIADIFGNSFSPAIAENYIKAWGGILGTAALQSVDKALVKSGVISAPALPAWKDATEWPLLKSFFQRYPTINSRDIERFWSDHREQISMESSVRSLVKEGKIDEAKKLLNESTGKNLKPVNKAMRSMLQTVQAIQQSEKYDADQKRDMIDQIYLQMMAIAQASVKK